ncbi:MAG: aminotransferase class V-fold PLP-dependent enzyme [Myxococcota bacterium]|nr:aminotransferase class V-fold PLP-dependent enzyme [Myxococcota bacterium]
MATDPLLQWRSEFPILDKKAGYLISNSLGAMPRQVYDQLKAYADLWASEGVVAWHTWMPMVPQTAGMLGRILNAPPGTMTMHQNVSTLTSILISALDFSGKRNKVVTTELNFPSVVYNWVAQQERGARVEVVKSRDGGLNIQTEDLIRAIDDTTLVVPLDLVLFRSSGLLEIQPIIEAAHRHGAMVVLDCYQATGAVPINVQALKVDCLLGGSVKWLCGGPGAAYLYVREDLIPRLKPRMTGWFSDKQPFDFRFGEVDYAEDAHRFMGGTPSVPTLYQARAGYEIIEKVGVVAIREKSLRQTTLLMELADAQGLTVRTPRAPERRGNTVCMEFEGSEDACGKLIERGFVVDHRPGAGVRVSPHFYNSDEECRAIMAEIQSLRASGTLRKGPLGHRAH